VKYHRVGETEAKSEARLLTKKKYFGVPQVQRSPQKLAEAGLHCQAEIVK